MREHSHDREESAFRPRASRIDPDPPEHVVRAAATGRTDVLSASDLLALQRLSGNAGVGSVLGEDPSPVHGVVSSPGRPLEEPVRADMEARLGHDFGDVRIHDDGAAHASARAVNAHAYTVGSHVVFQRDAYDPSSSSGRQTLAHELTHVVQQRSGPVEGTSAPGGIAVSDPSDRFEREAAATAERAVATGVPATSTPAAAVQRSPDEPDSRIQRQEAEEEEENAQRSVQRDEVPEELTEHSAG